MTKQLLKGFWAASLVAVLAVLCVSAEAAEIRCNVPFSFTVNGKTLPAGTYRASSGWSSRFCRDRTQVSRSATRRRALRVADHRFVVALRVRRVAYDLRPRARSRLQAPEPCVATYRNTKQYTTASSPLFWMGQN